MPRAPTKPWLSALLLAQVALTAGCGTLCWSTLDLLDDMKDEDDVFESKPFNFHYRYPGNPYVDITARKQSQDSTLELIAFGPVVFFQIIAEEAEQPIDAKTLARVSMENLKEVAKDAVSTPPTPWSNGQLEGLRFSSEGTIDDDPARWEHWVIGHNGYVYQLIASSETESQEVLKREAERLFASFSLIDPARRSTKLSGEPFGRRVTAAHPWVLDLEGLDFESLAKGKSGIVTEHLGRSSTRPVYFALTPLRLEAPLPRRAALEQLAMMTLRWQSDHSETVPLGIAEDGGETRIRFALSRLNEGSEMKYLFGVVARGQDAAFLTVWGEDESAVRKDGDALFQRLAFREGAPAWRFEDLPEDLKGAHVAAHGLVGQHYLETNNPAEAIPYLRVASQRARNDVDRLTALLRAQASAGAHEAALKALAEAPRELQEGQVLRSWRAWLLIEAGKREEGLSLFGRLFDEGYREDDDFSYFVKALEADQGVDAAAKAYGAYRARESTEPLTLGHAELLARHERYRDAIQVLLDAQKGKALSPKILFAVIDYELELGHGEEALAWVKKLEDNGYASADTRYFRGRALYAQGKLEEARRTFEEAKKQNPDDEALASWTEHLARLLGEGSQSGLVRDIEPVPLPEGVRAKMAAVDKRPAPSGHGASYAHVVRALHYQKGAPVTETFRWRVRIADDRGVSLFKTFRFPFDPLAEVVQVHRVVVSDARGQEVAAADPRTFFVADEESDGDIHTDRKLLHIPVPRLEPGRVLDVVISQRSLGAADAPPYRSVSLSRGLPVGFAAFVATGDGLAPIARNGVKRLQVPGGIAFFVESPPLIKREPWSPSAVTWAPVAVVGDAAASWDVVSRDYLARIAPKLAGGDELRAISDEVLRGAASREEKIDRVWAYAQSKLSYNAIEFGLKGILPTPPLEAARRGYGDCKDHAVLMHALLREAGVPSSLVLVHTHEPLVKELPSLDQFDHMILYVPDERGGRFIDATDKSSSRAFRAPYYLRGQTALVLTDKGGQLKVIPESEAGVATTHVEREVHVLASRERAVTERVRFEGSEASGVRDHLKGLNDEDRRSWARYVISKASPRARLDGFEVVGLSEVGRPLEVTLRYTLEAAAGAELAGLVPPSWERYFFEHPLVEERTSPFWVRDTMRFTSETRVQVPASLPVRAHAQARRKERTVTGDCESRISADGAVRTHHFRCSMKAGRFGAERYDAHRKAMLGLLEHAAGAFVLERAPDAS